MALIVKGASLRPKHSDYLASRWSLSRTLALLVVIGFVFLFIEVQYEHRRAIGEHPTAWIPVLFSGVAIAIGSLAVLLWRWGGRLAMGALSAIACMIGFLGIWHHTDGNPVAIARVLSMGGTEVSGEVEEESENAEEGQMPRPEMEQESEAPLLAPLAFTGMGVMGLLAASGQRVGSDRKNA